MAHIISALLVITGPRETFTHPNLQANLMEDPVIPLSIQICKAVSKLSGHPLFYIFNLRSDFSTTELLRNLHENNIQSVSLTRNHALEKTINIAGPKNMIFYLNNIRDIPSLILGSARATPSEQPLSLREDEIPNFCVESDLYSEAFGVTQESACDLRMRITSAELEPNSVLTDHVLAFTRGLYTHPTWNFENHLIFAVKGLKTSRTDPRFSNTSESENLDLVIPYFKFFWRLFRGRKTTICLETFCVWHDSFTNRLHRYSGHPKETYFDFSLRNLHGRTIGYCYRDNEALKTDSLMFWNLWSQILGTALFELPRILNCTVTAFVFSPDAIEVDEGLRNAIDLIVHNVGLDSLKKNPSEVHYSTTIESCSLFMVAPRRGFLPQYLAPFSAFSRLTWAMILLTAIIFLVAQRLYLSTQLKAFGGLYSVAEKDTLSGTSAFFTVCAYFLCGSPPRLVLGRLHTGKILFLIFAFTALIIGTLFLSKMQTLLSARVREPDIETFQELKDLGVYIQSTGSEAQRDLFNELNDTEWLGNKVIGSFSTYTDALVDLGLSVPDEQASDMKGLNYTDVVEGYFQNGTRFFKRNLRAMWETDAFLVNVPSSAVLSDGNLLLTNLFTEDVLEYHCVEKSLVTYPLTYRILRHSFVFDAVDDVIARMFENGYVSRVTGREFLEGLGISSGAALSLQSLLRPFSMRDFQLAFIGLGIGLFVSCLVFVGEIVRSVIK